ncbi:4458_t:CDS:1, partial [Gigaspora rosea]
GFATRAYAPHLYAQVWAYGTSARPSTNVLVWAFANFSLNLA